jgi:hypothetical protein
MEMVNSTVLEFFPKKEGQEKKVGNKKTGRASSS